MNGNRSTSKISDTTDIVNIIPPKLIRNYEVYIVLKPKSSNTTEESDLIDFNTDTNTKLGELLPIGDNSSDLTDTEEKKELSVIDLFEDIAVSPQTLRFQKESVEKEIFDPLESKNIPDEYDKYAALRDLDKSYVDSISMQSDLNVFDNKPELSIPKLKYIKNIDEPDEIDHEDLIEELLSNNIKRLDINDKKHEIYNSYKASTVGLEKPYGNGNKAAISSPSNNQPNTSKDFGVTPTLNKIEAARNTRQMSFEIPKIIRNENRLSLPFGNKTLEEKQENDITNTKNTSIGIHETPKVIKNNTQALPSNYKINVSNDLGAIPKIKRNDSTNVTSTNLRLQNLVQYILPSKIYEKPMPYEEIRRHIDHLLNSKTVFCNLLKYYNPIDFYATSHDGPQFVVDTIPLDMKKYRKSRIIVEDSKVKEYTQGPDLDEKRLVLPQIMNRLVMKKTRMNIFMNCKQKLILDCGSQRKKEIPIELNPQVLKEDCNKDKLKDFLIRQSFDDFVNTTKTN